MEPTPETIEKIIAQRMADRIEEECAKILGATEQAQTSYTVSTSSASLCMEILLQVQACIEELRATAERPFHELAEKHGYSLKEGDLLVLPDRPEIHVPESLQDRVKTSKYIGEALLIRRPKPVFAIEE